MVKEYHVGHAGIAHVMNGGVVVFLPRTDFGTMTVKAGNEPFSLFGF